MSLTSAAAQPQPLPSADYGRIGGVATNIDVTMTQAAPSFVSDARTSVAAVRDANRAIDRAHELLAHGDLDAARGALALGIDRFDDARHGQRLTQMRLENASDMNERKRATALRVAAQLEGVVDAAEERLLIVARPAYNVHSGEQASRITQARAAAAEQASADSLTTLAEERMPASEAATAKAVAELTKASRMRILTEAFVHERDGSDGFEHPVATPANMAWVTADMFVKSAKTYTTTAITARVAAAGADRSARAALDLYIDGKVDPRSKGHAPQRLDDARGQLTISTAKLRELPARRARLVQDAGNHAAVVNSTTTEIAREATKARTSAARLIDLLSQHVPPAQQAEIA